MQAATSLDLHHSSCKDGAKSRVHLLYSFESTSRLLSWNELAACQWLRGKGDTPQYHAEQSTSYRSKQAGLQRQDMHHVYLIKECFIT